MSGFSASAIGQSSRSTLGQLFFRRVSELGCRAFLKIQRGGSFEDKSWRDVGAMVRSILWGLHQLGMSKGDHIAILGDNSLPRLCVDLATLAAGLPNVVISPNVSDSTLLKILAHSRCRAIFIDAVAAPRLLAVKAQLPNLSHAIMLDAGAEEPCGCMAFAELLERGGHGEASRLDELLQAVRPDDLATIMYTSGSTGEPKGVMRTHNNLISNIASGGDVVLSKAEELTIIALSLNHLFGRYGFLKSAVTGRTTAMIEATEVNLDLSVIQGLRPTAMSVVPRVMERLWNAILGRGSISELWDRFEKLDRDNRLTGSGDHAVGEIEPIKASLREAAQQALGGRVKYITYGGAAMPPPIQRFFAVIGVPLIGSYGSTECGGVTLSGIGNAEPGSLGRPFPNVELRLAEDGELLVRGPTVTPGYFEDPQATHEAFDADGWFRTGDLGKINNEGSLFIVGRKKDLFNCADGSNINPGTIEALLENDAFIRQAVLVGDHRPFIAALIVPERYRIAVAIGKMETALSERDVEAALRQRVELINTQLDRYEKIRKVAVLPNDFPEKLRRITALQKIKIDRRAIEETYHGEIEAIYSGAGEQSEASAIEFS
jgi:long-chain acyl-CoA synthetase